MTAKILTCFTFTYYVTHTKHEKEFWKYFKFATLQQTVAPKYMLFKKAKRNRAKEYKKGWAAFSANFYTHSCIISSTKIFMLSTTYIIS